MEANDVPNLLNGGYPIIVNPDQARRISICGKMAVIRHRMTTKFYKFLIGKAREGPQQRL